MKLIKYALIIGIILIVSSCSRKDRIFSAFDELHYIILYKKNNDFEILYNGINTAVGKYSIKGDTIRLTYDKNKFKEFDPNEKLTKVILINKNSKRVKSIDNTKSPFCADIDLDKRK